MRGVDSRKIWYGRMFVLPWVIGIIIFFIIPIVQSVFYSFSKVSFTQEGLTAKFAGLKHYYYVLMEDPKYTNNLAKAISSILYSLPVIIILSLIIAIVLNQKFRGRTIFRGVFFLPVIITSGVVIQLLFLYTSAAEMQGGVVEASQSYTGGMIDMNAVLNQLEMPVQAAKFFSVAISNIFDLIWNCGIQIVLFIAGMQTIPEQLYEVGKVEGCSKWEEFWFVTLPMLSRVLILVMVFTMIELFTAKTNPVVSQAYNLMYQQNYDESSAMLWIYFVIVGGILSMVMLIYSELCLKKWE